MTEKYLNECIVPDPIEPPLNIDGPEKYCANCEEPTQKYVGFYEDLKKSQANIGIGQSANCDPIQSGQIAENMAKRPNRNTIYRYSKGIRGCDEAIIDLFSD